MRRTAVLAFALALGLTGCVEKEAAAPEPAHSGSPVTTESTEPAATAQLVAGGGGGILCLPKGGKILLHQSFRATGPVTLEGLALDGVNVQLGRSWVGPRTSDHPVTGLYAWPLPAGQPVPEGWRKRRPVMDAELAAGSWAIYAVVDQRLPSTVDRLVLQYRVGDAMTPPDVVELAETIQTRETC